MGAEACENSIRINLPKGRFCFTHFRGEYFLPTAFFSLGPSGTPSFAVRFYLPLYFTDGLRRPYLSLFEERYGRKTNQRAPKPPFGFWLFIRGFGGETCVSPTNSHWCILRDLGPSVACGKHTVSTDSIVLHRLRRIRNTYRITGLICGRK